MRQRLDEARQIADKIGGPALVEVQRQAHVLAYFECRQKIEQAEPKELSPSGRSCFSGGLARNDTISSGGSARSDRRNIPWLGDNSVINIDQAFTMRPR
jgi:hypothetical protein